ncbi:hypothetical protein PG991_013877 [Apiospora marii]|uniref:F-box domain-containing protein n=1 Tax=Apiospora marii TaxID=335849 RepID=A0ABR1R783_9PEZI
MPDDSTPSTVKQTDLTMPTSDFQVPVMDLQTAREPHFDATDNAATTAHRSKVAPLLRIPKELRDEIYSYFLVADMNWFSEVERHNQAWWTDHSIVQINQQTRAEAWDYLVKRNLWVRVTLDKTLSKARRHYLPDIFAERLKLYLEFSSSNRRSDESSFCWRLYQPYFPLCEGGPPGKSSEVLASEATVSLWLGETYDPRSNAAADENSTQISFMFAYEPRRHNIFIRELLSYASEYKSMTIQPNLVTVPGSERFAKLIEPMSTMRGLDNVLFVGISDCPTLQALGRDMKPPFDSELEVIKNQKYVLEQGRAAELRGCYAAAMRFYEFDLDWTPELWMSWKSMKLEELRSQLVDGSPVNNSLSHIRTEMCIGFSRSAHKFVTELRKRAPDGPLHTLDGIGLWIGKSIHWAREAFAFDGMTDLQRRQAHLYSAFAFQAEAEFMENIPWEQRYWAPISSYPFQYHWHSPVDFWDDGRDSYEAAAKNLFYAKEVDISYDILEHLDEEDRAICGKIQSPPPEGFELAERKIPLMDDWKGDPEIWKEWCRKGSPRMKKLFEQRHIVDSGTEPESRDDLVARYSAVGVTWHDREPDGYGMGYGPLEMSTNNPDYQD